MRTYQKSNQYSFLLQSCCWLLFLPCSDSSVACLPVNLSPFSPLAALHNHYMLSSPDTSQIVSFAVFAGHLPFSVCWDPKKVRFWSIPPVQSPGTDQVDKLIRRCKFPVLPNAVPLRLNSQWSTVGTDWVRVAGQKRTTTQKMRQTLHNALADLPFQQLDPQTHFGRNNAPDSG